MSRILSPEILEARSKLKATLAANALKEPYRVDFHRTEGWAKYKGLKYTRGRGWWKDAGIHELARRMVRLGLEDAPVKCHDERGMHCLTYGSLYWLAEHDITDNEAGISYYKHAEYVRGDNEED